MQVLYNAYYHLSADSLVNLFQIPVDDGVSYRTYDTSEFPNYDDVYFRTKTFHPLVQNNISTITGWLPYSPVIVRIKNYGAISSYANQWNPNDSYHRAIINWVDAGGDSSLTDFHDVLVVDYGVANDSTYFTCVNSLFESGPGYFKIHANE